MEYIVIPDTAIGAVNRGKQENESSSGNCIGECQIEECYFVIYTSGIRIK